MVTLINKKILYKLLELQDILEEKGYDKYAFIIRRGHRTPKYNTDIGGASRRIYSIGSENFTVTYPESTFDTYVFTVRDFTGKTALGDTYLEAWRVINGTDTLIERQIIDVHNEVGIWPARLSMIENGSPKNPILCNKNTLCISSTSFDD